MWYAIGVVAILLFGFVAWRWTSVGRGARERDERILRLLDPIGEKFDAGEVVSKEEVLELAQRPELRFMLFTALREMGHPELLPSGFSSVRDQAESALVYWLLHPNELQDPPEEIQHVQEVVRPFGDSNGVFHVFRYRMPKGHWAEENGWMLGLAGPVDDELEPYSFLPGAFSRVDGIDGDVTPEEVVDWYVDMLKGKGAIE